LSCGELLSLFSARCALVYWWDQRIRQPFASLQAAKTKWYEVARRVVHCMTLTESPACPLRFLESLTIQFRKMRLDIHRAKQSCCSSEIEIILLSLRVSSGLACKPEAIQYYVEIRQSTSSQNITSQMTAKTAGITIQLLFGVRSSVT